MKLLLIVPSCKLDNPMPTLGIACLSAYIKSKNHEVKVLDLWEKTLSDEELKNEIAHFAPDLIGVTFYTIRYNAVCDLVNKLKLWFSETSIVAGGTHPSALPQEVLREIPSIDFLVIGEGEITLAEVLELNTFSISRLSKINGVAYRDGNEIVLTPPREFIKDLDELPYADLEQLHPVRYKIHPPFGWYGLPLTMITTRGCPGLCTFCSKAVYKNRYRSYTPQRVIDEIKYWKNKLPVKEIKFYDDDFTLSQKRTFEICDLMIKENINLPWTCTTRVDCLSRDLLIKMKEAGLYFIVLGVETGSPKVLENLKKGYTVEHIVNAFKWCRELNIPTFGFFMVGLPGETDEDVQMTLDLQKQIRPNYLSYGYLKIYPGAPLFDVCKNDPIYNLSKETQYNDVFRKDFPEEYWTKIIKKAMNKHYFSYIGLKAILLYLRKTRNFGVVNNYIDLIKSKRHKLLKEVK